MEKSNASRIFYLDNLKVFLTLLVVFYHSAHAYLPSPSWPYSPSSQEYISGIGNFLIIDSSFFMSLFFFISGYFIPNSLKSHSLSSFVGTKILRYGFPVVLLSGSGHLWYVESLLLFSLVIALYYRMFGFSRLDKLGNDFSVNSVLCVILVMSILTVLVRSVFPIGHWVYPFKYFNFEPAHYMQYIIMFVLGIVSYNKNLLSNMSVEMGVSCLIIGLALIMGILFYNIYSTKWNEIQYHKWYGFYESIICVIFSIGLLWLFRDYANWDCKFLRWCSAQSYGVYIFHIQVLLYFQNMFECMSFSSPIKFFMETLTTLVYLFIAVFGLRLIPGVKLII